MTRRELNKKVEKIRELTGNENIVITCCNGYYGLYEELCTHYRGVLGSSGFNDMRAKNMGFFLDGIISGLSYRKEPEIHEED